MSNLLTIPFKTTYNVDLKAPCRDFITRSGGHPDDFRDDIQAWQDLRSKATGTMVHVNCIDTALLYHAQLVSIMAKLPTDIQVEFAWATAFETNPNVIPITLTNLVFERACVVFNLAALYSQLAHSEDRSAPDGIKRAASYYQQAAGSFAYLKSSVLPKLSCGPEYDIPPDLEAKLISAFEVLMLAQAQECSWQMAKLNNYKNALIAKISARVSSLYESAVTTFNEAGKKIVPKEWIAHVQVKSYHFKAVAEFRKSIDEIENGTRYGFELARLANARLYAQQAYEFSRRGRISGPVMQDATSLLDVIERNLSRSQRDNDLIYHQDVPTSSMLPAIQETNLVTSKTPPNLLNPEAALTSKRPLFGDLVGWGTQEAINIYNDRKSNLLKVQIFDISQELQHSADGALRDLNLPASLEALERPIGLPPSLLRKAEEVRLENGCERIEASLENVETLGQRDRNILETAMDVLDSEASEDESARQDYHINRPPSHEANVDLTSKAERYRHILDQARDSDETVRQKWYDWEDHIRQLTLDEASLQSTVPSSTFPGANQGTPQARNTRKHARALRVKLEDLDVVHRDREDLVRRARALAEIDDIRPRIMKAASGFEKLATVQPAMFEDVSDDELSKYDKYLQELSDLAKRQELLLQDIRAENDLFLKSRKDDPTVKDRERALQTLEAAYLKYKEITKNLDEGNKFYNSLGDILIQFRDVCKQWAQQRNQELHSMTTRFQNMSLS